MMNDHIHYCLSRRKGDGHYHTWKIATDWPHIKTFKEWDISHWMLECFWVKGSTSQADSSLDWHESNQKRAVLKELNYRKVSLLSRFGLSNKSWSTPYRQPCSSSSSCSSLFVPHGQCSHAWLHTTAATSTPALPFPITHNLILYNSSRRGDEGPLRMKALNANVAS